MSTPSTPAPEGDLRTRTAVALSKAATAKGTRLGLLRFPLADAVLSEVVEPELARLREENDRLADEAEDLRRENHDFASDNTTLRRERDAARADYVATGATLDHATDRLSDMVDDAGLARPDGLADALDSVHLLIDRAEVTEVYVRNASLRSDIRVAREERDVVIRNSDKLRAEVERLHTLVSRLTLAAIDSTTWGGDDETHAREVAAAEAAIQTARDTADSMAAEPWHVMRRERDEARATVLTVARLLGCSHYIDGLTEKRIAEGLRELGKSVRDLTAERDKARARQANSATLNRRLESDAVALRNVVRWLERDIKHLRSAEVDVQAAIRVARDAVRDEALRGAGGYVIATTAVQALAAAGMLRPASIVTAEDTRPTLVDPDPLRHTSSDGEDPGDPFEITGHPYVPTEACHACGQTQAAHKSECPSPLSDYGRHHPDYYDVHRFRCDWCYQQAPDLSLAGVVEAREQAQDAEDRETADAPRPTPDTAEES